MAPCSDPVPINLILTSIGSWAEGAAFPLRQRRSVRLGCASRGNVSMSAVALFYQLPKSAIDGLREVAVPKKQWLGGPKDEFWEYLKQHGREVANYPGSGYVLGDVMDWLQQEYRIELERSRYEELCNFV